MKYHCDFCGKDSDGEESSDLLHAPAIICEFCGSEILVFDDEPDWDAAMKDDLL